MRGFSIMGKVFKIDGVLGEKTNEFMAFGNSIATRCDSCIRFHVGSLAWLVRTKRCAKPWPWRPIGRCGPSFAYSARALRAYDVFSE